MAGRVAADRAGDSFDGITIPYAASLDYPAGNLTGVLPQPAEKLLFVCDSFCFFNKIKSLHQRRRLFILRLHNV